MVEFYTSVIFLSLSFSLSREEKKMMKMGMTITNLSGTSSKKSTQIRIVAVVKSQTSLACEAFVLRELNACVLCASYVEGCIPWTLSCAEVPCVESEQCSGVPPEPWLFFFFCVSMNDLDPLVKYTCLVITKSYQMACKCF